MVVDTSSSSTSKDRADEEDLDDVVVHVEDRLQFDGEPPSPIRASELTSSPKAAQPRRSIHFQSASVDFDFTDQKLSASFDQPAEAADGTPAEVSYSDGSTMQDHRNWFVRSWFSLVSLFWRRKYSVLYFIIMASVLVILGIFVWTSFKWKAWLVVAMLVIIMWAMFNDFPPDMVLLSAITIIMAFEISTPEQALAGFSNPTVFAIAILLVICAGLDVSGVLDDVFSRLFTLVRRPWQVHVFVMLPVILLSAVVPDTPLIACTMPAFLKYGPKMGLSPSKVLMPLAYATIFGGQLTIMGSSTNLFVSGLISNSVSTVKIGFFDIAYLGGPVMLLGFIYVLIFSRFIPDRASKGDQLVERSDFVVSVEILPMCPLAGLTVGRAKLRWIPKMPLTRVDRSNGVSFADPADDVVLMAGDRLCLSGSPADIKLLFRIPRLTSALSSLHGVAQGPVDEFEERNRSTIELHDRLHTAHVGLGTSFDSTRPSRHMRSFSTGTAVGSHPAVELQETSAHRVKFADVKGPTVAVLKPSKPVKKTWKKRIILEVVISPTSRLVGRTAFESNFQNAYDAVIMGVIRYGAPLTNLTSVRFQSGDLMLLHAAPTFLMNHRGGQDFVVISHVQGGEMYKESRKNKIIACLSLLGVVVCTAANVLSFTALTLLGAFTQLFTKTSTIEIARKSITPFILTLACAFGLSDAIYNSGVGPEWGRNIVSIFGGMGDAGIIAGVYICSTILTSFVTNAAAVAIMFPIINGVAQKAEFVHLEKGMYLILMMAASACFSSPIAYPASMMVSGPGGYRFTDFVKFGFALHIASGILCIAVCYAAFA